MMAENKKSFLLYVDFAQHLGLLTDTEIGQLFRAVFAYVNNGDIPQNLSPAAAMLFSVLRAQLDRDAEKWADVREKRRAAGRAGAAATNSKRAANAANADFAEQKAAKPTVNVNENATVNETVTVNENKGAAAPTRKRFHPPDEQTVCDFFKSNGSTAAEGSKFYDFYTSKGWKIGTAPMKNWESAARNWLRRNNQYQLPQPSTGDYDVLELLRGDC